MTTKLPLIIFDGNCQGQHLSAILSASNMAECYAIGQDLGFLPSHLGVACKFIDEGAAYQLIITAREHGRWVIQASQSTPRSDQMNASYSDLVNQTIRYPHLQFYAVSPSETAQKFGPKATPHRMLEMDISIIETCQKRARSVVDFAGFIRENAGKRPLFHTALHPGGELMAMMLRSFAIQIPGVDERLVSCAESFLRNNEGINSSTYHPVQKDILDVLGFDWGADYELYRQMLDQRSSGDWQGILNDEQRYIEKFGNDTWCWIALTQAQTAIGGKVEGAASLGRLLELSPGQVHSWLYGLNVYIKHDDQNGVLALMHRANSFFRGQRIFSQVMAYFYLNTGRASEAEPYARDYHLRTPDRADALVPLLKTLWFLGRHDEMKQIVDFVRANSSQAQLSEVRANFSGSPELEAYLP